MTDTERDLSLDIVDAADGPGADLNRQADAFLKENEKRRPVTSVKAAVREDADGLRTAAQDRAALAREHLAANPRSSVLYALGAGVLLGLILAR